MSRRKPTLAERAAICRSMAASHYRLAENTRALADRMIRDAEAMERGVDPFRCAICAELLTTRAGDCPSCEGKCPTCGRSLLAGAHRSDADLERCWRLREGDSTPER